jgi:O-methyltransferase
MENVRTADQVMQRTRTLIREKLEQRGYMIEHSPGSLWRRDPVFPKVMSSVRKRTLLRPVRCFMLWQFARLCASLPGDAAELGVYKGGSAMVIAAAYAPAGSPVHLFDTFAGMPAPDPDKDGPAHRAGEFNKTSSESVAEFLRGFPALQIHAGVFPDSAASVSERRFGFVHVDAVIYQSVRDACEFFYPRMVPGGVMVFDDYDSPQCPGAALAVNSYFHDRPERLVLLPTRQCVVHRLP